MTIGATKCDACGASMDSRYFGLLESRLSPEQEASLPIPKFVPTLIGLLSLVGAAWGLLAAASSGTPQPGVTGAMIWLLMALMYAFGGYCGLRAIQRRHGWVRLNQVLWAAQVPVLVSPVLSYAFASGGSLAVSLQLHPSFSFAANASFGSSLSINLFSAGELSVGANLLALGIAYYLTRLQTERGARPQPA